MRVFLSLVLVGFALVGGGGAQTPTSPTTAGAKLLVVQVNHVIVTGFATNNKSELNEMLSFVNGFKNRYYAYKNAPWHEKSNAYAELNRWWNGRSDYLSKEQLLNNTEWEKTRNAYDVLQAYQDSYPSDGSILFEDARVAYLTTTEALGQFAHLESLYDDATQEFATAPAANQDELRCLVFPLSVECLPKNQAQTDPDADQIQGLWGDNEPGQNLFSGLPRLIRILMQVAASLIFLGILWTGLIMLTSAGDEEAMGNAKQYFIWLVVGALVISLAYSIVQIVYNFFAS